jgi:hypothetical protein
MTCAGTLRRILIGYGDEFGDPCQTPIAAAISRVIAQQLLGHGEGLD